MEVLLLLAHGSRLEESNSEVIALTNQIEKISAQEFDSVRYAFLEYAKPSFHSQVDDLIQMGATKIIVFPFFLASGSHVKNDIPRLLHEAETKHPQTLFILTPHLGAIHGMETLILKHVKGR